MYARRFLSAIAAMVSIAVCLFITWISRDVDQNTIVFNLVFLSVMLFMLAAAYLVGIRRLMSICKGLRQGIDAIRTGAEADSDAARRSMFQNEFLDDCFQQYRYMSKNNPDSSCDIHSFINEEVIESHVHRGLLEMIPDILTSLGILGTFVGLVMGLQEFDPSGYEQMAGSVTPLINGIKVAFITSIYGISLSLAFSFQLRSEFSNLSSLMEEFLDTYYLHVRPPYEIDSLSKLLEHQKSQEDMAQNLTNLFVQQMGKSFEQAITPAFARMTTSINRVVTAFTESQEEVIRQVCENVMVQMREELSADFAQISTSMAEMERSQKNYVDFMDRSLMRMQQTFLSLQQHMQETDKYNSDSLRQLSDAHKEAYRITQEQKATYQEYIRFMYQSIEQFSAIWEANSEKMQQYSDEIAHMGPVLSTQDMKQELQQISNALQSLQKQQNIAETDSEEDLHDMLAQTLDKLDSLEELIASPRLFRRRTAKQS